MTKCGANDGLHSARESRAVEKLYFRVREVCEMTGLSKSKVHQALKLGKLDGKKLDGCLLIPAASLDRYLASAIPWQAAASAQQQYKRDDR